jgi:Universal stress protein UspA and related nucleotide-binding proteins
MRKKKVLIAYDGSDSAKAAVKDWLGAESAVEGEALVVSVVDLDKTAPAFSYDLGVFGKYVSRRLLDETIALMHREKERLETEAKGSTKRAAELVRRNLPGWFVSERTAVGDPAEEILKIAEEWNADLIVVGSRGRSALGRLFFGSVSRKIAEKARCPVRIGQAALASGGASSEDFGLPK